jgi:hypothetical protein
MSTTVVAGLVGVLGAVVGGLAAFAGQWWHSRTEHQRHREVRADALRDVRRTACVGYLAQLDLFRERARDVLSAMNGGSSDGRAVAQSRYTQAWRGLVDALAALQIAGPERISAAGVELHNAATAFGAAVDARADGGAWSRSGDELDKRVLEVRRDFAATCRAALALDA